jgi:hypothetical protein
MGRQKGAETSKIARFTRSGVETKKMRREKYFLDDQRAETRGTQYFEKKSENRKVHFSSGTGLW